MKKNKILTILLSLLMIISISCEKDWLDVNTDPNYPSNVSPELVLPSAINSATAVIGGEYNLVGGIWSQYWTQSNSANQYKDYTNFSLPATTVDRQFRELFSGALNDFNYVLQKAEESEDWGLYLISNVMSAYVWQVLADMYDQIPFNEALQGSSNIHPHYDDGQTVYDSLIARIDRAISKDLSVSSVSAIGNKDFIFSGDYDAWIQFANTLKLKIYLHQVYARESISNTGITALLAENNFLEESANMDIYEDITGKSNPLYEADRRALNTTQNIRASSTFMYWLQQNGDPREPFIYEESVNGGWGWLVHGNHEAPTIDVNPADVSRAVLEATDPVQLISLTETYFMLAEAHLRYGSATTAQTMYEAGVTEAFAQFGLDASSFIGAGGVYEYPAGTFNENLEAIMMQKWAALARFQGLEAYFEHLRTGYPRISTVDFEDASYTAGEFTVPINSVIGDNFPKRFPLVDSEISRNPNAPTAANITAPVWWDQN